MSVKRIHVLAFWASALKDACASLSNKSVRSVSAGEVAKRVGMSRTTAKHWLSQLVVEGMAIDISYTMPNGIVATFYSPLNVVRYQ